MFVRILTHCVVLTAVAGAGIDLVCNRQGSTIFGNPVPNPAAICGVAGTPTTCAVSTDSLPKQMQLHCDSFTTPQLSLSSIQQILKGLALPLGHCHPRRARPAHIISAPPSSLPAQTVDQYGTNPSVVSVPTGDVFPAGTFPKRNVCQGKVLTVDLTTSGPPYTKVGTAYLFKDYSDVLHVSPVLDVLANGTFGQLLFGQPNAFLSQNGLTTGQFSPAGSLLFYDTVPAQASPRWCMCCGFG